MGTAVPPLDALTALPTDEWSRFLAATLAVLRALPEDQVDASVRRVVATPPARLVAGRARELVARLARRPAVWASVAGRLDEGVLDALAAGGDPAAEGVPGLAEATARADAAEERAVAAEERAVAAGERAAGLRARLDEARRAAEGATARAEAADERAAAAEEARDRALSALADARAALDGARDERERAVARERRRTAARDERDRDELRGARRRLAAAEDELASLRERLRDAERAASRRDDPPGGGPAPGPVDAGAGAGRRGRPSLLPEGVVAGTRAAATWLVGAGVPLLVDGYNVTRQHRGEQSLADQRRWLEARVAALARRRGVTATIVWDSSVGASTQRSRAGVTVRYTAPEMTADDELVLHVRTLLGPDDPVVVVTDDAELRRRLAALGADLLDTTSFTWLL